MDVNRNLSLLLFFIIEELGADFVERLGNVRLSFRTWGILEMVHVL